MSTGRWLALALAFTTCGRRNLAAGPPGEGRGEITSVGTWMSRWKLGLMVRISGLL